MDLQRIGYAFGRGCYDSLSGMVTIFSLNREINEKLRDSPARHVPLIRQRSTSKETTPVRENTHPQESAILKRTVYCGLLNGVIFMMSMILFEHVFLKALGRLLGENNRLWLWIQMLSLLIYRAGWVIPLFFISKCINTLYFQDIADWAYKHTRGRPQKHQSISYLIADSAFSLVIQTLFLIQASLTSYFPIQSVGYVLSMVQMCLLYSLYSFEYKWYNMGWELHRRLSFIETHWPYFIGFGLPMTIFTQVTDSLLISGCIFGVLFPFFIISGNGANPVSHNSDVALHIFSPVITISNMLFGLMGLQKKEKQLYPVARSTASTPRR